MPEPVVPAVPPVVPTVPEPVAWRISTSLNPSLYALGMTTVPPEFYTLS